jgi:hypothetical protein
VVSWDATTQSEFAAQGQRSLLVVRAQGCELELLPQCEIAGEYRLRETPGSYQALEVSSSKELYAKLSFSVAALSGHLGTDKSLVVKYFIRGLRYATAPAIFRDDLPAGCEGATHFVLNYAAGAYALESTAGRAAGAAVEVESVAAVGGKGEQRASILFRGGDLDGCKAKAFECTAPVRLRLLPILDGAASSSAARLALTKPEHGTQLQPITQEVIRNVVRSAAQPMSICARRNLVPGATARINSKFTIGTDGVVTHVEHDRNVGVPDGMAECAEDVMYGLRFPASTKPSTISYPWVITL